MKKIWLALAGMVLAFSASAAQSATVNSISRWINRSLANPRYWSFSPSTAHIVISLKKCFMCLTM